MLKSVRIFPETGLFFIEVTLGFKFGFLFLLREIPLISQYYVSSLYVNSCQGSCWINPILEMHGVCRCKEIGRWVFVALYSVQGD